MKRIARKTLEYQLARVNTKLAAHGQPLWELDYNRYNGGYQIVFQHAPGNTLTHRMPAREMWRWLDGAEMTLWALKEKETK